MQCLIFSRDILFAVGNDTGDVAVSGNERGRGKQAGERGDLGEAHGEGSERTEVKEKEYQR